MRIDTRTWTDEQLIEAVKTSTSFNQVIKKLGVIGVKHRIVRGRTEYLKLDYSHFLGKRANVKGSENKLKIKGKPIKEILIKHAPGTFKNNSSKTKKRLYKENILKEICAICGQLPIWNNKPLVLRLDHINGENEDYRIENLRILCPHCDSQSSTFTGRNVRRKRLIAAGVDPDDPINYANKAIVTYNYKPVNPVMFKPSRFCNCGKVLNRHNKFFCSNQCLSQHNRKHIPPKEELEKSIKEGNTFLSLGKKYSVSDNAVRKWCKLYNIPYKLKDRKLLNNSAPGEA